MERPNYLEHNVVAGLLSEIVIDAQMRDYRKRTLYEEIDDALAQKNKERFLLLTSELCEIIAYEQTETG